MTAKTPSDTPIRAVLWDFGGVLTTSPFEAFNRYEAQAHLPHDFIRTLNSVNSETNASAQLERGELNTTQFYAAFESAAAGAGQIVDGAAVLRCVRGELRQEMVNALQAVSKRYKTACLTNNFGSSEETSIDAGPTQHVMKLFDVIIESSKIGLRKPEPAFYQRACDVLQILPHEAVFLDDLGINLKPARAMGMRTIKVICSEQALSELETFLGHNVN